jgi:hypothetical protein
MTIFWGSLDALFSSAFPATSLTRGLFCRKGASAYCRKIVFSGFGGRKDPNSIGGLETAGVLRLRAISAVLCDESVRRSAQDDDFWGSLDALFSSAFPANSLTGGIFL